MKSHNDIDELLRREFQDFRPEAPDVWNAVSKGVQAAQSGSGVVAAGKSIAGVVTKWAVVAVATLSVGIVTYVLITKESSEDIANSQVINPERSVEVAESLPQSTQEITPLSTTPSPKTEVRQPEAAVLKGSNPVTTPSLSVENQAPQPMADKVLKPTPEILPVVGLEKKEVVPTGQTNSSDHSTAAVEKDKKEEKVRTTSPPTQEKDQPLDISDAQSGNETKEESSPVIIPGSFSPNGDGANDVFKIVIDNVQLYHLVIHDRSGRKVFESLDKDYYWDGKDMATGQLCAPGVYVLIFQYQHIGASKPKQKSAYFQLF